MSVPVALGGFRVSTQTTRTPQANQAEHLVSVVIGTPVATSVITLKDGATTVATITVPASPQPVSLWFGGLRFANGITCTQATASSDFTVSFY